MFLHGGYPQKILSRFSPKSEILFVTDHSDKAVDAWENCLAQLHTKADMVFFGDSITRRGDFASAFPDKVVCNLGLGSDTISGMTERIDMIVDVSPDKVFIMGGINSLRNNTIKQCISEYDSLLKKISVEITADVFVISVLPISQSKSESIGCSADTIVSFNKAINDLSEKYGYTYIDLYPLFVSTDGAINSELTTDGVHLTENAYKIWAESITEYIR